MTVHPAAIADRFIHAIVWGEHTVVWTMLSEVGREHVLEAGGRRGLDPVQAERIRQGTTQREELDAFLTDLVHGLRVDFAAVPIDDVRAEVQPIPEGAAVVEVGLLCPATLGEGSWAAGSLHLSRIDDTWGVDRVHPLVSRGE